MKTFLILIGCLFILCMSVNLPYPSQFAYADDNPEAAEEIAKAGKSDAQVEESMGKITSILWMFLVLSVVFEVALTPIFNWRVFLARFEGKGLKTPITVILAFLVFWRYDLDIIKDLLNALGRADVGVTTGGQFLTALLIAGGSDGVFRIFRKLHIREEAGEREKRVKDAQSALAKKK